jgi:uncharacterized protein
MISAEDIIARLELQPHPEGGYFRETFRDQSSVGRAFSTAIYYLLKRGQRSHWHRVDAAEVWHWYGGGPLALSIAQAGRVDIHRLGMDLAAGEAPQAIVPPDCWQSAEPLGDWALVGCTVAPAFEFSKFEMAPQGWTP